MELSNQLAAFIFEMNNCQYITKGDGLFFTDGIEFYQGENSTLVSHNRLRSDKLVKVIKQAISAEKLTGKGIQINTNYTVEQIDLAIKALYEKQEELFEYQESLFQNHCKLECTLNLILYNNNIGCLLDIRNAISQDHCLSAEPIIEYSLIHFLWEKFGQYLFEGETLEMWLKRFKPVDEKLDGVRYLDRKPNGSRLTLLSILFVVKSIKSKWPFDFNNYVLNRWGVKDFKNKVIEWYKKEGSNIEKKLNGDNDLVAFVKRIESCYDISISSEFEESKRIVKNMPPK